MINDPKGHLQNMLVHGMNVLREPTGKKYGSRADIRSNLYQFVRGFRYIGNGWLNTVKSFKSVMSVQGYCNGSHHTIKKNEEKGEDNDRKSCFSVAGDASCGIKFLPATRARHLRRKRWRRERDCKMKQSRSRCAD